MKNLARLCVRHRWIVLLVWVLLFLGTNAAARAEGSAYANTFSLPGTNSTHAYDLLKSAFPGQAGDTDQIVIHATSGTVASHERTIQAALAAVARQPVVASVVSPFCSAPFASERLPSGACAGATQVSKDGAVAYAVVHFALPGFKLRTPQIQAVETQALTMGSPDLGVYFGGNAFGQLSSPSSSKGEVVGLLLTAVVLVLAFGSFLAMLLPLGIALFALGVALAGGELLSHAIAIAQFAPILGSLIGLGVGIDYALFIITRTRQEFKRGATSEEAIVTAINTSGRAVLFAGSTVCIALLGMLVLRLSFLNGVAVSATLAVLVTMLASVTLLPALVALIGPRVLSRRERARLAEHGPEPVLPSGPWQRWARFVSNHPRTLSALALVVIALFVVPFFSLRLGSSDQGNDPVGSTTRRAYDLLAQGFGPGFNGPLSVVGAIHGPKDTAAMTALDARLAHDPGVASVLPLYENPAHTVGIITVVPTTSPQSVQTAALINRLRDHYIPRATHTSHTAVYVGGITAIYADFAQVLGAKLPLFLGVIVLLGCLLLMVAFRSLLIPVVAAIMNLLAVGASFGLVVAVFQWGWGSALIRAGTGPIESFLPIIMIAILFGLSMDYQVFLVSRMHEEWLNTGSNEEAIVRGQANTGRVITAAALVMVSVFFSFAFGGQRIIAEFGIGLGGAVVIDAFIIRTVLVPALMHFIGRANWWMPGWLERSIPHVAVEATEETD